MSRYIMYLLNQGRHQWGRNSDPDLRGYTRYSVVDTVRQELDARLDPFLDTIRSTIQATLEQHKLPAKPTVAEKQMLPEHAQKLAVQDTQIIELCHSLQQLRFEKEEVERAFKRANEEKELIMQKLYSSEKKAQKLQVMILDSGHGPSGADDEEIRKRFIALRHNILQLVKKHCANHNATNKDNYARLSDEAKDFWVMSIITRALHQYCFDDQNIYFGLDHDSDIILNRFYHSVRGQTTEDKVEWRARTCLLGASWEGQSAERQMLAQQLASSICKNLTGFMSNGGRRPSVSDKSSVAAEVKASLVPICDEALKLALIFNSSNTEYMWATRETELDEEQVEIMRTAGFNSFSECNRSYRVVFGGVCKGGGLQGKLADGIVHLTGTEVLLGPFQH